MDEIEQLEARLLDLKNRVALLRKKNGRAVFRENWFKSNTLLRRILAFPPDAVPVSSENQGVLVELLKKKVKNEAVTGRIWILPDVFVFTPEQLIAIPHPRVFFTHPNGQNSSDPFFGGKIGCWRPLLFSPTNVEERGSRSDGITATFKRFECRGWILKIWRLNNLIEGGQNGWAIGVMERSRVGVRDHVLPEPFRPMT